MSILEFLENNISFDLPPILQAVILGIIFLLVYDFYHLLFSAVLSWFKRK